MKKGVSLLAIAAVSLALAGSASAMQADPVETREGYGFPGEYDQELADDTCYSIGEGTEVFENVILKCHQETAIQNSEDSVVIIHRSFITDSVLPLVTADTGKSFIINSSVQSTSGGAVFAGLAVPAEEEGTPLSVYAYGSDIQALSNGNGIYIEFLGDAYVYGSSVSGVEAGIESGTFGSITVGSLKDGQENEALSAVLSDISAESADADMPTIIESNGNAIVIGSVNDYDFWDLAELSESEAAALSTQVTIKNAEVRTLKQANRSARWQREDTEYGKHVKGSVIVVKSTNADIFVENSVLEPYAKGTGCILQTVIGDDDEDYLMTVADGEEVPGITASFKDMELNGDIAHEDYQRDLKVELSGAVWTGAANEYDAAHWNSVAEEEGFDDLCFDSSYETHHGISVSLAEGSVWNVTQESRISALSIGEGCSVNGVITVDGNEVPAEAGEYEGEIIISPAE